MQKIRNAVGPIKETPPKPKTKFGPGLSNAKADKSNEATKRPKASQDPNSGFVRYRLLFITLFIILFLQTVNVF